MKLTINLETKQKVGGADLVFKSLDLVPVEVSFLSGTNFVDLPMDASGRIGIKRNPSDAEFLSQSSSWSKSGIGSTAVYTFDLNFNTEAILTALGSTNSIPAFLEVEWHYGGYRFYSASIPVVIAKTIITGEEGTPTANEDPKANRAEAEAGQNNSKWMTPLSTFQAIAAWVSVRSFATTSSVAAAISSAIAAIQSALDGKQAAGNYATLDSSNKIPASLLPSYVDDVIEYPTLSALLLTTGEGGKIYTVIDTGKIYRWGGSSYIEISSSPGSTDAVPEGSVNLYFSAARAVSALSSTLLGYATQAWVSSAISGFQSVLDGKQAAGNYATLDSSNKIPASLLPSYVDDVIEYPTLSALLLTTGEGGKIYTVIDTGKIYRWGGSSYIEISSSPGSTDAVPEGSGNLYFSPARARAACIPNGSGVDAIVAITQADYNLLTTPSPTTLYIIT